MTARMLLIPIFTAVVAMAQSSGTIVFRESFGPGPNFERPKSGKGTLKPVFAGTNLSGFWAEFPANKSTTWMGIDTAGVPGWNFAGTSVNPNEAPTPLQTEGVNGTAWCFNDLGAFQKVDLLAPMVSPGTRFTISAELMPRPILGHYTALGVTNSNVLEDNFEGSAVVWVRILAQATGVQGAGVAEFRTKGLAGPSTTLQVPVDFNGFNTVTITVDPVAGQATATVNGIAMGTLPVAKGSTKYLGVEGSGGVDNLVVRMVP